MKMFTALVFGLALVFSTAAYAAPQPQPQPMPKPQPTAAMQPAMTAAPAATVQPMAAAQPATMAAVAAPTVEEKKPEEKKGMTSNQILDLIFKLLAGIASLVFTILGGLGYMKWTKSDRWKQIQKYADMAFPAVEALVKKTENKVDDKLVEFLKEINELLKKHGEKELTEVEEKAAAEVAAKKALAEKLTGLSTADGRAVARAAERNG